MQVNNVSVSHDNKKMHLANVTTAIPLGKITTIIGPNGCGKSTLMSTLSREHKPKRGQVLLHDKDISIYQSKEFAKKLAIVYQQNTAPQDITIEKLVGFGRLPYQSLLAAKQFEDIDAITWALKSTKLWEKRQQAVTALSGGERQRVWLAMALAQQTEVLCLDEPTTYLDMYYQIELLELVQQLNRKHQLTIIMVLHDINQAIRYSDHIIVMKQGGIIAEGAPSIIDATLIKEVYHVQAAVRQEEGETYIVPLGVE